MKVLLCAPYKIGITNFAGTKKYKQLINSVVSRGYITEDEKKFLFSYNSKKK